MRSQLDWMRGFALALGKDSGQAAWTERHLSDMKEIFADRSAAEEQLKAEDPLIYRFHELGAPEEDGVLSFGITELMPGTVDGEYYMTKGHFHKKLMTSEVYLCLEGEGGMMLEDPEGDWRFVSMHPMEAVYVPRGYAHRSINTGKEVLRMFFCYAADAGHDYKTIETKGYRHLVCDKDGAPEIRRNPRWKE